jgi:hypothetical protein
LFYLIDSLIDYDLKKNREIVKWEGNVMNGMLGLKRDVNLQSLVFFHSYEDIREVLTNDLIFFILVFIYRCSALVRAVLNGANILMLECFYLSLVLYITLFLLFNKFTYYLIFLCKIFYIYFYAVKDVLINPSNREELEVDKLLMNFNCPRFSGVGTRIDPNVPPGISKMLIFYL